MAKMADHAYEGGLPTSVYWCMYSADGGLHQCGRPHSEHPAPRGEEDEGWTRNADGTLSRPLRPETLDHCRAFAAFGAVPLPQPAEERRIGDKTRIEWAAAYERGDRDASVFQELLSAAFSEPER